MLRVAAVGYLNARPLTAGLDGDERLRVEHVPPAAAAAALVEGRADLALVPAVTLLDGDFVPVPGLGIAARGRVDSVFLYRNRNASAAGPFRLALDPASRSSQALTRIALEDFLAVDAARITSVERDPGEAVSHPQEHDAVLVIGDRAMALDPGSDWERIDLAELWLERTGHPFVFAVWGTKPAVLEANSWLTERLGAALAEAEADLPAFARREAPRHGVDGDVAAEYLESRILFRLGDDERAGLEEFLRRVRLKRAATAVDGDTPCST